MSISLLQTSGLVLKEVEAKGEIIIVFLKSPGSVELIGDGLSGEILSEPLGIIAGSLLTRIFSSGGSRSSRGGGSGGSATVGGDEA